MNEVRLQGTLHKTSSQVLSSNLEVWIWIGVDGQWLPVLCRGAAAKMVVKCQNGALLEIHGSLEYLQVEPEKWTLRVIGTTANNITPVQKKETSPRSSKHTHWDDDWGYEDLLVEISPGFYWDPIDHEYVGNPDEPSYSGFSDYNDDYEVDDLESDDW